MSTQLRVCAGGSILIPAGGEAPERLFLAGESIPPGLLTDRKKIEGHIKDGYLEVVQEKTSLGVDDLTLPDNVPGVVESPVLKSNDNPKDQVQTSNPIKVSNPPVTPPATPAAPASNALTVSNPNGATVQAQSKENADPTTQQTSVWTFDPAELVGKDIDTLNVMVLEQDQSIEPFETSEEAIAQLSADFQAVT